MLRENERIRYSRNLAIPGFGVAGQERLANGRVLIVGLGGLGAPAALYLAAAGVGTLGLADSDTVEMSNLQRQVLHATPDIGRPKTESAAESLVALNPHVHLERHTVRVTPENALQLAASYDAVVESSDNFETKLLINDVCLELKKPFATAGVLTLSGQAMFVVPGRSACLRCALPSAPQDVPDTAGQGVLGATPGIFGSIQAMEVLRWLGGLWKPEPDGAALAHCLDGTAMRFTTIRIARRSGCRCAALWKRT